MLEIRYILGCVGFGIIFFLPVLMMASLIVEKIIIRMIVSIIVSFILSFCLVAYIKYDNEQFERKWNNGYCLECGEKWELFDVEHIKNSGDIYYYKDKNNHIIIK